MAEERTNPHVQLGVGVDASDAKAGFQEIEDSAKRMAAGVAGAAGNAAAAVDGLGNAAGESSRKTEAATSGILASIKRAMNENQRAIVEAQGYSRTSAEGLEELARLRGADVTAIQGQLGALRELRAQLDGLRAAQSDAMLAQSYEREREAAEQANRRADAIFALSQALDIQQAREQELAGLATFEREREAAEQSRRRADAVFALTQALDIQEAREREIAGLADFERERAAAELAQRRADATFALSQALDIQEAREREIAALPAFEREREAAEQARRRADATYALSQALDQQEAAERRVAQQNSFIDSLRGQAETIGKTRSEILAMQAAQLGVTDKAAPFIAALKEQETRFNAYGKSAKEVTMALRGVPAQITDIFVSLQGGQAPLTVLLQQGGQLKDMFGGIVPAARALGGAALGLINPFTLAAAAAAALSAAYLSGDAESKRLAASLILTGNQAGVTAGQLGAMARAVASIGAGTQGRAAEVLALLSSAGAVGAANMQRFTEAALRLQKAGGPAAEETAKAFADLAKKPLEASLKLNEGTNYLTESVYKQIKALEEQGRTTDAARVAQEAYYNVVNTRTPTLLENLGYIERAWIGIKGAVTGAIDAAKNFGRRDTVEGQLERMRALLAERESAGGPRRGSNRSQDDYERANQAIREQINMLSRRLVIERESAYADGARADAMKARAEADKDGVKYLSEQARMTRQIAEETERIRRAYTGMNSPDDVARMNREIAEREKLIRQSYQRSSGRVGSGSAGDPFAADRNAAKEWAQFYQRAADLADKAAGKVANLSEAQSELLTFLQSPAYDKASEAARQMTLEKLYEAAAHEQASAAQKESARIAEEAAKSYAKWIGELEKSADAVASTVAGMEAEEKAARIAEEGYYSLAQAIQLVEIARLEEMQVASMGNEDAVLALQREIDKRRELIGLIGQKDARDAAADAAKATLDEFNRINDQIGQSLADALMEGGKSAWEYIKGLFRSQVLAPIIKAVVQPITGSIASMVTGSPAGGSGGGSWMNNLGTIGSAAQAMWGLSAGASTASLAAANAVGMAGGDALGALIAGNGGWAGVSAGAGATAAGTAMSTLAAAAPWIAAAVAIVSILSNQNKWSGQFGEAQVRNGRASDVDSRSTFTNSSYSAEMSKAASTVGESIAQTIAAFGGASSDLILRQFSATASKKDRAQAGFDGFVNGQFFSTGSIEVSKDEQAQAFADQALRATVLALQSTVEGRFGEYFDSVNALEADIPDLQALLETAAAVQQFGKQVEWLGGVFDSLGGLGVQVTADLATAAGGFDALTSSLSSAYQVLYTEEERLAFLTDDVSAAFQKLGVEMPLSADEYRAALEAAEDGLASGADGADKLYATLLQLAPAWGQVADAAKQAAQEALEAQMDAVKRQMDDITSQYGDVAGAMRELESPAMTLVDAWRQTRSELERLDDVLGGGVLDGLDGLISQFTGLRSVRQSLDQQILDLQIQAAGPNAAAFLRQREATLWAQINGGGDIAGASEELARVIAQRVQLESQAVQDSTQVRIDAEIAVKEAALEAYRQQVEAIERIQDTVRSLLIGDLSPLSPGRRAAEAGSQYRDVLARAQGGDVQALQDLPSMAQEYLRQAQQFGNPQAYARQFYEVLGQLQGLGVDGPGLDQRESELDVLREQRDALADNTRILSETASAQINLLTVLRDRVAAEEAQRRAQLEEERATREALKEGQEAQIRQHAAIFEGMQQELEALNTSVNEIAERVGTIVNRPT